MIRVGGCVAGLSLSNPSAMRMGPNSDDPDLPCDTETSESSCVGSARTLRSLDQRGGKIKEASPTAINTTAMMR